MALGFSFSRLAPLVVAAFAVVAAAIGCQAIAGIEDRNFVPGGGGGSDDAGKVVSPLCKKYCDTVMSACPESESQHFSVYPSKDACLSLCPHLEEGEESKPTGNTVACRLKQANLAAQSGELSLYCPKASPGGGGECGDDCESWCSLYEELCPNPVSNCVDKCQAVLIDQKTFDAQKDHDGDTVECRLVHVSNSSFAPETHCSHAAFQSTEYCIAPDVTCDRYCTVVMTTCSEDNAVYENKSECMSTCGALDLGEGTDTTQDTVGCRKYHAYNAFATDPVAHCPHAGPLGDGHCGTDNCAPYCKIVAKACPTDFASAFKDEDDCLAKCDALDGPKTDSHANLANAATSGPIACRTYEAVKGFADATHCAAAVGKAALCN